MDSLPSELFKDEGEDLRTMLIQQILKIWKEKRIPEDWKMGLMCPILTKGPRMNVVITKA